MTATPDSGLHTALLAATLLAPWLALAVLAFTRATGRALLLPLAPVAALLAALVLPDGTALTAALLPAGLSFGMDATARVFLLPAALVWTLSGWLACQLRPEQARSPLFAALWLLALAGNLALILAQDLLALYAGIALMTFAALGLIVFERTAEALAAGRLYLVMMMLAEVALFVAIAALVTDAGGDTRFDAAATRLPGPVLALLALAFGLKLGALGLHSWLPRAHPVAPVPASAVLSGVMIKAGILGWLRLVQPSADTIGSALPPLLVVLGVAGALYAALRGLACRDPKVLLGWSSVSQMGLLTVLAGLALITGEPAIAAISVLVIHHGLAKAALFLGVGLLGAAAGRRRTGIWIGLWLPALALAGAPATTGVLAKSALDLAVAATGQGAGLTAALHLTGLASALLMLRFLWLTRGTPAPDTAQAPAVGRYPELPWLLLLGAVLLLPWLLFQGAPVMAAAATLSGQAAAALPLAVALPIAVAASRWPGATQRATGLRRYRPSFGFRAKNVPAGRPLAFHLAVWERHLHAWRLIGRAVVLVTLALGAAIGLGLTR
ncbi:proton-conducting transporter transmembrane domain-containing protein [Thioalkalivibrio paradoxus]|uniref:Formate hydrogenlyase n=1 Tax=Thioalkalivibrio paradoxus ARh 1 TaxID=713585 RepID=W0DKQ1_9GAMM|nr:proton-conducting transporter membrane subunit [Thioalkalivibrio paradoxus]AHE97583.1 formate hydrogenlyase [Thioalkalivibrio paradoxus ARh 1]